MEVLGDDVSESSSSSQNLRHVITFITTVWANYRSAEHCFSALTQIFSNCDNKYDNFQKSRVGRRSKMSSPSDYTPSFCSRSSSSTNFLLLNAKMGGLKDEEDHVSESSSLSHLLSQFEQIIPKLSPAFLHSHTKVGYRKCSIICSNCNS